MTKPYYRFFFIRVDGSSKMCHVCGNVKTMPQTFMLISNKILTYLQYSKRFGTSSDVYVIRLSYVVSLNTFGDIESTTVIGLHVSE